MNIPYAYVQALFTGSMLGQSIVYLLCGELVASSILFLSATIAVIWDKRQDYMRE